MSGQKCSQDIQNKLQYLTRTFKSSNITLCYSFSCKKKVRLSEYYQENVLVTGIYYILCVLLYIIRYVKQDVAAVVVEL